MRRGWLEYTINNSVSVCCSSYLLGLPLPSLEISRLFFASSALIIGVQYIYCHACMYVRTATFEEMKKKIFRAEEVCAA